MTEFMLATHNDRKLAELNQLLQAYGHTGVACGITLPEEGDTSLQINAQKKAAAVHRAFPHVWVLGDDSGLFLKGLPDRLGVRTARELPRKHTNEALQRLLAPGIDRRATLKSVLTLISPSGQETSATGALDAVVAPVDRGEYSRGFDKVLIPVGEALTLAEMSAATRQAYLPRERALSALFA
ncbi:non-canonical purine NTP pyrophosphatase [Lacticaseibacillus sp. GG6-2]